MNRQSSSLASGSQSPNRTPTVAGSSGDRRRWRRNQRRRNNPQRLDDSSNMATPSRYQANISSNRWSCQLYEEEMTVLLDYMPPDVTTLEVWNSFSKQGNISKIFIYENKPEWSKNRQGRILFSPPPLQDFWSKRDHPFSRLDGSTVWIKIERLFRNSVLYTPSPVDGQIKYPTFISLIAESLHFGVMHTENAMMTMHSCDKENSVIRFRLDLSRKQIDILFTLAIVDPRSVRGKVRHGNGDVGKFNRVELMKFTLSFSHLRNMYELGSVSDELSLIATLDSPPSFFKKTSSIVETHDSTSDWWTERLAYYRQTDIVYSPEEFQKDPLTLRKPRAIIDIGRWTTYRFVFRLSEEQGQKYRTLCNALRDHNVLVTPTTDIKILEGKEPPVWEFIDPLPPTPGHSGFAAELNQLLDQDSQSLSYAVRYQLEVCVSQGILSEYNMTKEFIQRISKLSERDATAILEFIADKERRIFNPMDIFDMVIPPNSLLRERVSSTHNSWTRSATITPSMIYYTSPFVETSNRVIRQYSEHSDRFLRVRFNDEKSVGGIYASTDNTRVEVFERVKHAMTNGIRIGDRKYEFLAFGNSQFRDHGAYFFAPIMGVISISMIRSWMGHFRELRLVPKHIARMGQCFSTTRAIRGARVKIVEIADINRNGYVFSDGVGKISPYLAQIAAGEMKIAVKSRGIPSVFQFRLGGCKGVLTVSKDARLNEIHIRRSQYKFAAVHEGLEIIRCSQFTTAMLNRQLILVLSSLGVPDSAFTNAQNRMLVELEVAMTDRSTALRILCANIDTNRTTMSIASLLQDGFMRSDEPFVMSLLYLWRAWSIKYLKEKSRISIDKGACLFGCLDEFGVLQGHFDAKQVGPDASYEEKLAALPEIFVQVEDRAAIEQGQYRVLEGVCILARNPSLHPGDIRVVRAVNVPELRDLRDVVVLPQTGDRDLSSMCSGGDLDGDDYMVIWDKSLIPKEWNVIPMDYTATKGYSLDRDVTNDDIISFFVTYMQTDRLPSIALSHLAWGDFSDDGVKSERCLMLANLHSKAVDYPKTGDPAVMPKYLKPNRWPHFMERKYASKAQTYTSKKVLGQLYDQVERVDFVPRYDSKFDKRILNAYKLDEEILKTVTEIKREYDDAMRRMMAQFEIRTEFEIWTSFVLQHSNATKDYKFAQDMGQRSEAFREKFRQLCYQKTNGGEYNALSKFVAAMYVATHAEIKKAEEEMRAKEKSPSRETDVEPMPLISFPWLFPEMLGRISRGIYSTMKSDYTDKELADMGIISTMADEKRKEATDVAKDGQAPKEYLSELENSEGMATRGEVLELFDDQIASKQLKSAGKADGINDNTDMSHDAVKDVGQDETPQSSALDDLAPLKAESQPNPTAEETNYQTREDSNNDNCEGEKDEGKKEEGEKHEGDKHEGEKHEDEGYEGKKLESDKHEGEEHEDEKHEGKKLESDKHEGEEHEDEKHDGEKLEDEGHEGKKHEGEGRENEGCKDENREGHNEERKDDEHEEERKDFYDRDYIVERTMGVNDVKSYLDSVDGNFTQDFRALYNLFDDEEYDEDAEQK